ISTDAHSMSPASATLLTPNLPGLSPPAAPGVPVSIGSASSSRTPSPGPLKRAPSQTLPGLTDGVIFRSQIPAPDSGMSFDCISLGSAWLHSWGLVLICLCPVAHPELHPD
ncbi:hypothetical protein P7K49_027759, partial [Saguinus oedipus]